MKKGFTLIELSIVLVIIGLIVGGVLVGQDLIRASELKSIQQDISKFEVARHAFRLKYNCLPGDCLNAGTFGLSGNGNGNKKIDKTNENSEAWQYWTHLADAGLIEGIYTGVAGPAAHYDAVIGSNAPAASMAGVGYSLLTHATVESWNNNLGEPGSLNAHFLIIGKDSTSGNFRTWGPAFDTIEVFAMDQKFDDGIANTGNIRIHADSGGYGTNCSTGGAPNHQYDISTENGCSMVHLFYP